MTRERNPISISSRIVVVSTITSIALLGSFGIFLDTLFTSYLTRQYRMLLSSRIQFVLSEIQEANESEDPEAEELKEIHDILENQNGVQRADRFWVQVLDGSGRPLMTMAGMVPILRSGAEFPSSSSDLQLIRINRKNLPDGSHLLLASARVTTPRGERNVKAALDWSGQDDALESFRRAAGAALLLGAVVSALVASWIARRALGPVRLLALAADRIEASRLDEPLDVTRAPRELRDLATSLGSMQRRLDESFTRLSAFAGDLAHELRTPLNNLMSGISVALSRTRSEDEYRDVLGSALEECGRLARTIDSLLFLARADRGAVELTATEFDLAGEVSSLVDYYAVYAEDRGIRITCQGDGRVVGDRELLRQAVGNLLANAVHYCNPGGLVAVRVTEQEGVVTIEVQDDGPGIAAEDAPRVYDRFFRASSARRAHPEGSGLGLAIVRSIAKLHAGEATIDDAPGRGTCSRLTLPSARRVNGEQPSNDSAAV